MRQIRDDLAAVISPDTLRGVCAQVGHTWRERVLDPVTTIHLFVLQTLHRNTACAHRPRLTRRSFTPSAYCQARARLPVAVLRELPARPADAVRPLTGGVDGRWRGSRVFFADGSGVTLPDTPALQAVFGHARPDLTTLGGLENQHRLCTEFARTGCERVSKAACCRVASVGGGGCPYA